MKFYRVNDEYGCFSNFSSHGFELKDTHWATSEHYFQAMKFYDFVTQEKIRNATSPREAAKIGRDRNNPLRADWESIKDDVMREAVLAKFKNHPDIQEILLSTGDEEIIEATTNDYYWGCGTDGTGKNMLGIILMEIRDKIRSS